MKTCPTHTEVYATKKRLRKAAPLKLKREFTGKKRRESQEGRLEAGATWALRNESVRAISEDGPYNDRLCPVARLAARTCGDLAKRARFIVPLLMPRNCLKTKRESTKARNELRHYKEGTRFRLVPGISDIVALRKDDESAYGMRPGKGRAKA